MFRFPDESSYISFLKTFKQNVEVSHHGENNWRASVILRSPCQFNYLKFPFDIQTCVMRFGSFSYDESLLEMSPENETADLSTYKGKNMFALLNWQQTIYATVTRLLVDLQYTPHTVVLFGLFHLKHMVPF